MKIKTFVFIGSLLFVQLKGLAGPVIDPGKEIFTLRCAACHNINKDLTGPALAGVDQRRTIDWIINFIHSPQKIIKSGDAYATALFNRFNNVTMPDHPDLSSGDIKLIIEHIKSESKQVTAEKPPFSKPGRLRPSYQPLTIKGDYGFFICFLVSIGLLIGVMIIGVDVKSIQRNKLNGLSKVQIKLT